MARHHSDVRVHLSPRRVSVEAYAHLREAHLSLVRTQLRRLGGEIAYPDLEDLEQEVWIAAWRSLPRFCGASSFGTWLIGVTKNIFRSWLRRKRSKQLGLEHFFELDDGASVDGVRDNPALNSLGVSEALDRISPPEHQVLDLRYFQQLSDREIARRLQLPLGTVKGRIRSGLIRLRRSLAEREAQPNGDKPKRRASEDLRQ